jgi:hypothetical protein
MLDHVSVGVTDCRRFYDAALRPLGLVRIVDFGNGRGSDYGAAAGSLGVEFTSPASRNSEPRFRAHTSASVRPIDGATDQADGATSLPALSRRGIRATLMRGPAMISVTRLPRVGRMR